MTRAKPIVSAAILPDIEPGDGSGVEPEVEDDDSGVEPEHEDPNAQYIEYREPVTEMREIPGMGTVPVQDVKVHRVLLSEWAAYEKAHGWA